MDKTEKTKVIDMQKALYHPGYIKIPAIIFSYIFHPLFIPVYITLFLLKTHPYIFAGLDDWSKLGTALQIFVNCTFLPLTSVLLLKALKFIQSIQLKSQKERIVPYMIIMIFYFWNWYAFKNNHAPVEMISLSMAIFNASVLGFLANISIKVSMHAIAAGLMSTYLVFLTLNDPINVTFYLSVAFIITGIVCTSRLIVSDHTDKEIYFGLFLGILSQVAAHFFVGKV